MKMIPISPKNSRSFELKFDFSTLCVGKTVGGKAMITSTIVFSNYFIPLQDEDRTFPFLIVICGVTM